MKQALHRVSDAAEGLALEAEAFAGSDPSVLLWSPQTAALVCPASFQHKQGFNNAAQQSANRGWPVQLRPTGGGVVPQSSGVLNMALAFTTTTAFNIEAGYRLITDIIRTALAPHHADLTTGATPDSFCDGAWNLSVRGQKVVGTAQRIRPLRNGRRRILAHALILMDGELEPGVAAVNALHANFGMPFVRTRAHTTLTSTLCQDWAIFPQKLNAAAHDALIEPEIQAVA